MLKNKLEALGRRAHAISMADLMWRAVAETEGLEALVKLERARGFDTAQRQADLYFSDPEFRPMPDLLAERMAGLDPKRDVMFLMWLAALAPAIYHMSKLLEKMMGRTAVTTIMFYPGGLDGKIQQ